MFILRFIIFSPEKSSKGSDLNGLTKCQIYRYQSVSRPFISRPRARYGLPPPPPPRGSFVDYNFLKAYCLRSILQHVSPLAVGALGGNSLL